MRQARNSLLIILAECFQQESAYTSSPVLKELESLPSCLWNRWLSRWKRFPSKSCQAIPGTLHTYKRVTTTVMQILSSHWLEHMPHVWPKHSTLHESIFSAPHSLHVWQPPLSSQVQRSSLWTPPGTGQDINSPNTTLQWPWDYQKPFCITTRPTNWSWKKICKVITILPSQISGYPSSPCILQCTPRTIPRMRKKKHLS